MGKIKSGIASNGNEVVLWRDVDGAYLVTTLLPGDRYRREYCRADNYLDANADYNDLLR